MKKYFSPILSIFLLAGTISIQLLYDNQKSKRQFVEPIVFKPEVVKAADLGLHNAASDLMWLAAIQYFGGGESRKNARLPAYLELSSSLDPKFAYPYAFGALILPSIGYTEEGIALSKKGIEENIQDWRIPYYLATTYFVNKQDSASAAKYFDLAANTEDVPEGVKKTSISFGSSATNRQKTKTIWAGIYESTKDEVVKERAERYLIRIELLDLLDASVKKYFELNQKNPANLEDLVTARILRSVPKDPFGYEYGISEKGQIYLK